MTNFIRDNTSLPAAKSNYQTRPDVPADQKQSASDYNAHRQALLDIQEYLRASGGGVGVDVRGFGAVGDGVTDDATAIRAAILQAVALKTGVYFPEGTYILGRDGSNSWCIDLGVSDVVLCGVPGRSVIKMKAGMPNASISLFRLNGLNNVTFRDLVFDGNWGNAATTISEASNLVSLPTATINVVDTSRFPSSGTFAVVCDGANNTQTITYTGKTATSFTGCTGGTGTLVSGAKLGRLDSNTGLNHTTQLDPKSHALMFRGATNCLVENCQFRDVYGDAMWFGYRGTPSEDVNVPCRNIRVVGCISEMVARNGISVGASTEGLTVRDSIFRYCFQTAFDTEPQTNNQYARDIVLDHCYFGLWWNPGNAAFHANQSLSIYGGNATGLTEASAARSYRVINCVIEGNVALVAARGVVVRDNTIVCDFDHGTEDGVSYPPIFIDHTCDDILIESNDIYDRGKHANSALEDANVHGGCITLMAYPPLQPGGVQVRNNRIKARNGRSGIMISGVGGYAGPGGTFLIGAKQYTATGVTGSTVTVTGAGWTTNQFQGWRVFMGGAVASVDSNTSDTLTLAIRVGTGITTAWNDPYGGNGSNVATPAVGSFTLSVPSGILDVSGNHVDCTNDGNGQGGRGIKLINLASGARVSMVHNRIKNAVTAGIEVVCTSPSVFPLVEIADNIAYDDQQTPTCFSVVHFRYALDGSIQKLILRDNIKTGGVSRSVTGLTTGWWLELDGDSQKWRGYGTPQNVVTAPKGSVATRVDGGANTSFYVKEADGSPIDVTAGYSSVTEFVAPAATFSSVPGDTTTVDACLVALILAAQPGSGTADWDTWTNAALASVTRRHQFTSVGAIVLATGVKTTAGAFGASSTRNNTAANHYGPAAITVAIKPASPGVPPQYVSTGNEETGSGAITITVDWPASGVLEGDYALMVVECLEGGTITLADAQGFTEIPDSPKTSTYTGSGTKLTVFECRAFRPAMTSPQVTVAGGGHILAAIHVFRGAAPANNSGWAAK